MIGEEEVVVGRCVVFFDVLCFDFDLDFVGF